MELLVKGPYMKRFTALAALLVVVFMSAIPAAAQQERSISLREAIQTALENNRSLGASRHKLNASEWGVRKAYTEFLPKVTVNQRLTRVDDFSVRQANFAIDGIKSMPGMEDIDIPPFLYKDTHETRLAVTQPIFTGGLLLSGLESAQILKETDEFNKLDSETEIVLQVTQAYLDFARSREFTEVRKGALELAQRNLENVRSKHELGLRPRSDILRWEAQVASDQSSLIEQENSVEIAKLNLLNLMGVSLTENLTVQPVTGAVVQSMAEQYARISGAGGPQALVQEAVNNNPGRKAVSLQKDLSRTAVKSARSGFLPQLSLSYNYSWQPNDTPSLDGFKQWDVSLNLSYSIFKGFGDVADMQKARAEVKQLELQEQDYDRNLQVSVISSYNNVRTALAKIDLYEKNLVQASDNLELVRSRFDLGLASNIELIDAQVLETTARVNLISARYDMLIAGAELDRLVGKNAYTN